MCLKFTGGKMRDPMFRKPEGLEEYSKFPVSRPCKGRQALVKRSANHLPVRGIGSECRASGGTIVINGNQYDFNNELWWKYVD